MLQIPLELMPLFIEEMIREQGETRHSTERSMRYSGSL